MGRLSWLNTDSEHICDVAIATDEHRADWRLAKICYQNQIDFNYLGVTEPKSGANRYRWIFPEDADPKELLGSVEPTLAVENHPDLRVRRLQKNGVELVIVHNEGDLNLQLNLAQVHQKLNPWTMALEPGSRELRLEPFELALLWEER